MKPIFNEATQELSISLDKSDGLSILAGEAIRAVVERRFGALQVKVLPRNQEKFSADLPIGDKGHLADLRGGTSGVYVERTNVTIWLSRTLLASNAFASEITTNITLRDAAESVSSVHIALPDLTEG